MSRKLGERFKIAEDPTDNIYVVRGIDPVSDRIWLAVEDADYDGHNGDLILSAVAEGVDVIRYHVMLKDERCSLPTAIGLVLV